MIYIIVSRIDSFCHITLSVLNHMQSSQCPVPCPLPSPRNPLFLVLLSRGQLCDSPETGRRSTSPRTLGCASRCQLVVISSLSRCGERYSVISTVHRNTSRSFRWRRVLLHGRLRKALRLLSALARRVSHVLVCIDRPRSELSSHTSISCHPASTVLHSQHQKVSHPSPPPLERKSNTSQA